MQVEGYLAADWDAPILFFDKDHCEIYSSFDGIGLIIDESLGVDWSTFGVTSCRRVLVQGKYEFLSYSKPKKGVISFRSVQAVIRDVNYIADITDDIKD